MLVNTFGGSRSILAGFGDVNLDWSILNSARQLRTIGILDSIANWGWGVGVSNTSWQCWRRCGQLISSREFCHNVALDDDVLKLCRWRRTIRGDSFENLFFCGDMRVMDKLPNKNIKYPIRAILTWYRVQSKSKCTRGKRNNEEHYTIRWCRISKISIGRKRTNVVGGWEVN